MNQDKLNELLSSIFDKKSFSMDKALLYFYSMDVSVKEHIPDAVVIPETREQLVHLVKLAYEHEIPIIPRGANVKDLQELIAEQLDLL